VFAWSAAIRLVYGAEDVKMSASWNLCTGSNPSRIFRAKIQCDSMTKRFLFGLLLVSVPAATANHDAVGERGILCGCCRSRRRRR
jgi:hypothetical protein